MVKPVCTSWVPMNRGAKGLCEALESVGSVTIGKSAFSKLLVKAFSFVTDGASANTGEKAGLWTLVKQLRQRTFDDTQDATAHCTDKKLSPLLTFWCGAPFKFRVGGSRQFGHRSKPHFQQLASLCSYFRKSGVRSQELRQTATEHGCKLLRLPRVFEVRWTEFTHDLLTDLLQSFSALLAYFEKSTETASRGFHLFLTDIDNIRTISFLADVLIVFSRFQKQIQSDDITVLDLSQYIERMKRKLLLLKSTVLTAVWVEQTEQKIMENQGVMYYENFALHKHDRRRRGEHHNT